MEILFWIAALLLIVWASFVVESDNVLKSIFGGLTIVAVIAYAANYFYGFWAALSAFIVANPFVVVLLIVGYFIIGAAYVAFWRYGSYIEDHNDEIRSMYKNYKDKHRSSEPRKLRDDSGMLMQPTYSKSEEEMKEDFLEDYSYVRRFGPMANKTRITNWMVWWPLSSLYHMTYRPVKAITNKIYNLLTKRLVAVFKNSGRNAIK